MVEVALYQKYWTIECCFFRTSELKHFYRHFYSFTYYDLTTTWLWGLTQTFRPGYKVLKTAVRGFKSRTNPNIFVCNSRGQTNVSPLRDFLALCYFFQQFFFNRSAPFCFSKKNKAICESGRSPYTQQNATYRI